MEKAILAASRKAYKEASKRTSDIIRILLSCGDLYEEPSCTCGYLSRVLRKELSEAKSKEKKLHDHYNRLRNYTRSVSTVINRIWLKRIRFASRAIGNEWDYSLKMVATPPTMASVDEYFDFCVLNIHQRGGVLVGSLA